MNTHSLRLAVAFAAAFMPGVAVAQHEAHQAGAPQAPPEMVQCARAQPVVDNIIAAATARLESARQSNSPTEMRAAVDHLEAALRDIRAQLAPCGVAAASADPHAGHAMPAAPTTPIADSPSKPAPSKPEPRQTADPHAAHGPGLQPEKQMDPVNGLMVDPATAPKTTYQGQTYYFSSKQTQEEFLKNPAKFAKPKP
jgi:YHS domain-containing protein